MAEAVVSQIGGNLSFLICFFRAWTTCFPHRLDTVLKHAPLQPSYYFTIPWPSDEGMFSCLFLVVRFAKLGT